MLTNEPYCKVLPKIFYKNSPLGVYRQEPSLEKNLNQSNHERRDKWVCEV